MDYSQKKTLKTVLQVIGIIVIVIAFINLYVIGFYKRDLPLFLTLLVVGVVLEIISKKIKIVKPGEDPSMLSIPGKWKCVCGDFNDVSDIYCGGCGRRQS